VTGPEPRTRHRHDLTQLRAHHDRRHRGTRRCNL